MGERGVGRVGVEVGWGSMRGVSNVQRNPKYF